jgi:hypothetical protein
MHYCNNLKFRVQITCFGQLLLPLKKRDIQEAR